MNAMKNKFTLASYDPVFCHHLYEYQKGLRSLILHTVNLQNTHWMIQKLTNAKVAFVSYDISEVRCNIFFGDDSCIKVIEAIGKRNLSNYSPEEDFILGIMLGYCRKKQCARYLKLREKRTVDPEILIG